MTSTGISKSVIISAMLKEVNDRFGKTGCIDQLQKFDNIQLITKGGSLIDMNEIDRIYVEY